MQQQEKEKKGLKKQPCIDYNNTRNGRTAIKKQHELTHEHWTSNKRKKSRLLRDEICLLGEYGWLKTNKSIDKIAYTQIEA